MSRKSYPNVNAANQYARDVVRGKIVACQFVIQACQRHLDDLMEEKSKSFRYRFDKDLAERAAKFIQLLPHTKGEWAFKRMPITLEPWQLFVICCAFGWVNKGSRLRRFREVYTEIPRKNGKSAISAGVALYCFACDNEFGAEVYSGATTEKQAWEVFRPARLMCKRTPMLTEAFGIEVNASNMNRPEDGARFEPLIGNPGDGSSPHCAVVDEYHEHATDALYTTMLTGMGARRQPLMWAITTAGYNIEGPCYDKRREVIEMLNGSVSKMPSMPFRPCRLRLHLRQAWSHLPRVIRGFAGMKFLSASITTALVGAKCCQRAYRLPWRRVPPERVLRFSPARWLQWRMSRLIISACRSTTRPPLTRWCRQLERAGIVENYELFKQYLVVERDASDPNRLNTLFPPDYVNQLRVFAVVNQFRLQYSEESA